jgi:hypothetical protein
MVKSPPAPRPVTPRQQLPAASDIYPSVTAYPSDKRPRTARRPGKWRPHPDNPDWAYLSPELEQDLVAAVRHGQPVRPILREYGLDNPMSFYRWRWVGEGRMRCWRDGRPIQPDVRQRYWEFCVALARARCEHATDKLEELLELQRVRP